MSLCVCSPHHRLSQPAAVVAQRSKRRSNTDRSYQTTQPTIACMQGMSSGGARDARVAGSSQPQPHPLSSRFSLGNVLDTLGLPHGIQLGVSFGRPPPSRAHSTGAGVLSETPKPGALDVPSCAACPSGSFDSHVSVAQCLQAGYCKTRPGCNHATMQPESVKSSAGIATCSSQSRRTQP